MATNFGTKIAINWLSVSNNDWAIGYGGGLSDQPTECRYCRYPAPKGCCCVNHFWLSVYGVHIGATWRIRVNRPCAVAIRPYVKLL